MMISNMKEAVKMYMSDYRRYASLSKGGGKSAASDSVCPYCKEPLFYLLLLAKIVLSEIPFIPNC